MLNKFPINLVNKIDLFNLNWKKELVIKNIFNIAINEIFNIIKFFIYIRG